MYLTRLTHFSLEDTTKNHNHCYTDLLELTLQTYQPERHFFYYKLYAFQNCKLVSLEVKRAFQLIATFGCFYPKMPCSQRHCQTNLCCQRDQVICHGCFFSELTPLYGVFYKTSAATTLTKHSRFRQIDPYNSIRFQDGLSGCLNVRKKGQTHTCNV